MLKKYLLNLLFELSFIITIFVISSINSAPVDAACPAGYSGSVYGPTGYCVSISNPTEPCLAVDVRTPVGFTILCTNGQIYSPDEVTDPVDPPDPDPPEGAESYSLAGSFNSTDDMYKFTVISSAWVATPEYSIFRGHGCEPGIFGQNILNNGSVQIIGPPTDGAGEFEWNHEIIGPLADFSVLVYSGQQGQVGYHYSNCLEKHTPVGDTDNSHPNDRTCPTAVNSVPNRRNISKNQDFSVVWEPRPDQIGNSNAFEAFLVTGGNLVNNLPIQEAVISGETIWVVRPDISSLDIGSSHSVVIYSEGVQCDRVIKNFEVTSGLSSGENPCIDTDGDGKVDKCRTALGDIDTDITKFAGNILTLALGLAGGIALILLVFGAIRVLVSSGDQQRLAGGRDTIIAALTGLLFIIFTVLILRSLGFIIGVSL